MYHLEQIPSEAKIRRFLKQILFGEHVFCPECKSFNIVRYETRYRCRNCRSKFSLLSHTFLKDSRIGLEQFWVVLWCWTRQKPVLQIQGMVSLSEKAVRHWFDLFRSNLPQDREILSHIVQLDEAYFGRFGRVALLMGKEVGGRNLRMRYYGITRQPSLMRYSLLSGIYRPKQSSMLMALSSTEVSRNGSQSPTP